MTSERKSPYHRLVQWRIRLKFAPLTASINIDASLIKSTRLTQTKEKVIALQNGCICCTLRGDLLSELIELSEKHSFDYVVIESSGSE